MTVTNNTQTLGARARDAINNAGDVAADQLLKVLDSEQAAVFIEKAGPVFLNTIAKLSGPDAKAEIDKVLPGLKDEQKEQLISMAKTAAVAIDGLRQGVALGGDAMATSNEVKKALESHDPADVKKAFDSMLSLARKLSSSPLFKSLVEKSKELYQKGKERLGWGTSGATATPPSTKDVMAPTADGAKVP